MAFPDADAALYQTMAVANDANQSINEAAGKFNGDGELIRKHDSFCTSREIEKYLQALPAPAPLKGLIYVSGPVEISTGQRVAISNGAFIVEGPLHLSGTASLGVTHSPATRTLPGVFALGNLGRLRVSRGATLRVHGLVYAGRTIEVTDDSEVDVVGAVLANDPGVSFVNRSSKVTIQYDPAVIGTVGLCLLPGSPVTAWVASWQELP